MLIDQLRLRNSWAVLSLVALVGGCATTPAKQAGSERGAAATSQASKDASNEDARKLERLERQMHVAQQRLARARMAQHHTEEAKQEAVEQARRELEITQQRVSTFTDMEVPTRLERSALSLRRAEDGVIESEEELSQLQKMYESEDFADDTKEIVIQRARRRVERSRVDLDLRRREAEVLRERTIPREITEKQLELRGKELGLKRAMQDAETAMLDQEIELLKLDHEILKLQEDLEDQRRKSAD